MIDTKRVYPYLLIAVLAFIAVGCQHGGIGEKSAVLGEGEVFVVGRIDLIPPLDTDEQELKTGLSGKLKNRGYVLLSDQLVDMDNLGMGAGRHAVLVDMNKHFVISRKRFEKMFYTGTLILTKSTATHSGYMNRNTTIDTSQLRLPGNMIYKIRPSDKAIYIGTLRYHRDTYNAVKKVQYVDEYNEALKEFRKSEGNARTMLRKVMPEQAPVAKK